MISSFARSFVGRRNGRWGEQFARRRLGLEHLEHRRLLAATAKNVIMLVGDGMGPEQVEAGRAYLGQDLLFESFPYEAELTTYSANNPITDSAAAATTLATGVKVNNGVISMAYPGDGSELTTSLEIQRDWDKMTGLVTTTYISHATPAGFGAHEPSRNNLEQIVDDYLNQTRPNVLLGGGANGISVSEAESAGYTVVETAAEMFALDTGTETMVSGQFGSGYLPYEYDGLGNLPHLSEMTATALDILDNDPDGFFLMVEGGRIDHACHDNDIVRATHEVIEFDNAVDVVYTWASGRTDTLIIVTADHETGGLTATPNEPGQYVDASWSSTGHTAANVPTYGWGTNSDMIGGVMDNDEVFPISIADNDLPTAAMASPEDNGPGDSDPTVGSVSVTTTQANFQVQLDDEGSIIDDATVVQGVESMTKDSVPMVEGTDYTFSYDGGSDMITLTPIGGDFGNGTYELTLNSGGSKIADQAANELATVTFTITINAVQNDPPIAVDDGPVNTDEDNAVVINVVANDYDPDGTIDPTTVVITTGPSYAGATATPNGDGTVTYDPTGSAALQALQVGQSTSDTFQYTVDDNLGATSNTATVTVNIDGVNDAPTANDDSDSTGIDTPVVIDVLANDTDPESDPLTVDSVTQPADGQVVINPDDTVTYTPDPGFVGDDTFTYKAYDGTIAGNSALVTVTVSQPIVAGDDFESGGFGGGSGWNESAWTESGSVTVTTSGAPENGVYHVLFKKGDGYMERSADLSSQAGAKLAFRAKVNGFESGDEAAVLVSPDGGGWSTVKTFTVADSDGIYYDYEIDVTSYGLSSTFFVAFDGNMDKTNDYFYVDDVQFIGTSAPQPQPPVANDDAYGATMDVQLVVPAPGLVENDTDPNPGDTITVYSVDTTGTLGTLDNWNADGSFSYTPPPGYTGQDTFSYVATDGGLQSGSATVTITITDPGQTQTFYSTDTPKEIRDAKNKPSKTVSELVISSTGITIGNLDMDLSITHTRPTDVRAYLISPAQTQVTLFENVDPIPTSFTSLGFVGESMDGTWTLELWDDLDRSTAGTLDSWSLTVTPQGGESQAMTSAAVDAAFASLAEADSSEDDDTAVDLPLPYLE